MRTLKNIYPGEVLKEEFLEPMGISDFRSPGGVWDRYRIVTQEFL